GEGSRLSDESVPRHPERGGHDGRPRRAGADRHRDGPGHPPDRGAAAPLAPGVPEALVRQARYWIASSARCRSDGGIVKPSALTVLKLRISLNVVARSTGRRAGFAPFRILSTKVAARRSMSVKLIPYPTTPPAMANSGNPLPGSRCLAARSAIGFALARRIVSS